jgi:hypothetical protein
VIPKNGGQAAFRHSGAGKVGKLSRTTDPHCKRRAYDRDGEDKEEGGGVRRMKV